MRVRTLPDDHDTMIELFLAELAQRVPLRGVIHVGAHAGQEVPHYLARDLRPVILIDANPAWVEVLAERYRRNEDVSVLHCAIGEADGEIDLNINVSRTGSDEASSILPLKRLSQIVPTLQTHRTIRVPVHSLDSLAQEHDWSACNFLNMDIQGAELMALRGAPKLLQQLDALLIETNVIEMYEGCATLEEFDAELGRAGFSCVERVLHELYDERGTFPAWGESLYLRT